MIGKLGWMEVVLILGIILIIFGPGKLPGVGRALGQTIRNYKEALGGKRENKEENKMGEIKD